MTQKSCYVKEGSAVQFRAEIDKEAELKNYYVKKYKANNPPKETQ